VPWAVNVAMAPTATEAVGGEIAIETSVAGGTTVAVTVNVVVPLTAPLAAVMVVVPAATPVARPLDKIVAVAVELELQVADPVMSFVVLSLLVASAVNCWLPLMETDGFAGEMAIEVTVTAGGFGGAAVLPPHPTTETIKDSATSARAKIPRSALIFIWGSLSVTAFAAFRCR
jgi:hypothetical protein